jgi:Bacterial Ig domain
MKRQGLMIALVALGLGGCVSSQNSGSQAIGPQECNPLNQNTPYGVNNVWPMQVGTAGCNSALSVNGTILSSSIVKQPANGTATLNLDEYTYTPKPGFKGKDSFVIKVTAQGGAAKGTSLITFDITVK